MWTSGEESLRGTAAVVAAALVDLDASTAIIVVAVSLDMVFFCLSLLKIALDGRVAGQATSQGALMFMLCLGTHGEIKHTLLG